MRLVAVIVLAATGCSAPALMSELSEAERLEREGKHDQALAAYVRAQASCKKIRKPRKRASACRSAYVGHAELLERVGRTKEAARAYSQIVLRLPGDRVVGSRARYRAGKLYLAAGQPRRAYASLWKAITEYPDEAHAADALKLILHDARKRNALDHLYRELHKLLVPLARTGVVDNILYTLARIAEDHLDDRKQALVYLDELGKPIYRKSGLYDDALWHAARLARQLGDGRGAARRLRKLVATREVAFGVGSYFSIWLDDAQLELGRVLRDDLRDYRAALAAFRTLPEHYPASILRDDALFEIAVTFAAMKEPTRACRTLAALAKAWPDSKYELSRAPALRQRLDCKPVR